MTASSTQAIDMFTYWHDGEPLLVLDEEPRAQQHPKHTHVVVRGTQRQRPPRGATTETTVQKTIYTLWRKTPAGHWRLIQGLHGTRPTNKLNVNTLMACARNPKNKWGIIDQGTLEQMDARVPQQLETLWRNCGVSPTSLLSMNRANSIVNGASTFVCIFRPFPTQVRIASSTTKADNSSLAF